MKLFKLKLAIWAEHWKRNKRLNLGDDFHHFEQLNLFQTLVNLFLFLSKEKEKEAKRKILVCQPFATVDEVDQNDVNQKVRETIVFFCLQRFLNLGWGGGQKYSQNRSKSSNKRKCHEGWSLKTLRIGGVDHQNCCGLNVFVQSKVRLHQAQQQLQMWGVDYVLPLVKLNIPKRVQMILVWTWWKYFWEYYEGPKKRIEIFDGGRPKKR